MTVTSSIVDQDTLTTSVAILRTGAATEYHEITFYNRTGSDVTVAVYINGTANTNQIGGDLFLEASGGHAIFKGRIGVGNTIQAKASANTSVTWTDEMTTL